MTAWAFPRGRTPRKRIPAARSPLAPGHISEGVGVATATAVSSRPIQTRAETAPCTCPEHCERDHDDE